MICVGSLRYPVGTIRQPGPGFFPLIAGSLLIALSLLFYIQLARSGKKRQDGAFWTDVPRTLKMTRVIAALILYAVCMQIVGFFLSTLLFLAFLLRGVDPQRWSVVIITSVSGTVFSYFIFRMWLDVPLPGGILLP